MSFPGSTIVDLIVDHWTLIAFVVLVGLPVGLQLPTLPNRIHDIRRGIRGVIYVPICATLLFGTALGAGMIAEAVPILQWGWLGENIVVAPITPEPGNGSGGGGWVTTLLFVPLIIVSIILFNYYEEKLYRDSYRAVAIWALLHLIMGIPLFAVFPIFAVGLLYKQIYDAHSLEIAYVAHLGTNMILIGLLLWLILF